MKIRRPSPTHLFLLATAAVTVIGALLRTVALFTNYDPVAQHYISSAVEVLSTYGFFLPLLILFPLLFLLPKSTRLTQLGEGKRLFYLPLALLLAVSSIELFVTVATERLTSLSLIFGTLAAVLAGAAALPYLFKLLKLSVSLGQQQLLLSLSSLFMIFYAMFLYFDERHYMNNPNVMLIILTAAVLALFFFYDARALSEDGTRLALFFMASGFALAVSTALPALLYRLFFGGLVSSLVFDLLLLSAALPLAARLFILFKQT